MNFQERFKGKVSLMTKNGPTELLSQVQNSIPKLLETIPKPSELHKPATKPLKLPLQTYNPKYPPEGAAREKQSALNSNPFLVYNPYPVSEDAENQQSNRVDINNFQAHYIRGSPSMKNPLTNSKDILLLNSRSIMGESPQQEYREKHEKRPPSFDNINQNMVQLNRKANTANGPLDNGELKYKPYTLKDYAELQQTASTTLQRGLGPNINTEEWNHKREKMEKMNNFAQYVKLFNSKKISETPKIGEIQNDNNEKLKSKREKAIDFAKNIPKPAPMRKKPEEDARNRQQTDEFKDELAVLEQQHLKLLNEVENLNNNGRLIKNK